MATQLTHVRRLSREEAHLVEELQEKYEQIPHHGDWFQRAILDVKAGLRPAFGIFLGNSGQVTLLASVILKRVPYTNSIELKNLTSNDTYVFELDSERDNRRFGQDEVFANLLEEVEAFARRRGFCELAIEVPQHWTSQIRFLVDYGFSFVAVVESYPARIANYYSFKKKIRGTYVGDPLDFLGMCHWLLEEYFAPPQNPGDALFDDFDPRYPIELRRHAPKNLRIKRVQISHEEHCFPCYVAAFPIYPVSPALSHDQIPLKALSVVDVYAVEREHLLITIRAMKRSGAALRLLLTNRRRDESKDLLQDCDDNSVTAFCREDIERIVGRELHPHIPISCEDVGGVMVLVGERFTKRIKEQTGEFAYVLLTGIGRAIQKRCEDPDRPPVAFFASSDETRDDIVVWGVAPILDVQFWKLSELNERERKQDGKVRPFLWSEQEKEFFMNSFTVNMNDERKAAILELGLPEFFQEGNLNSIPLADFAGDLASYLKSDLIDAGGFGAVYLTNELVEAVNSCRRGEAKVGVSHSIEQSEGKLRSPQTQDSTADLFNTDLTTRVESALIALKAFSNSGSADVDVLLDVINAAKAKGISTGTLANDLTTLGLDHVLSTVSEGRLLSAANNKERAMILDELKNATDVMNVERENRSHYELKQSKLGDDDSPDTKRRINDANMKLRRKAITIVSLLNSIRVEE